MRDCSHEKAVVNKDILKSVYIAKETLWESVILK